MNILFVCKFNRFRSRVAEAFFNKINTNEENVAKSAGIIRGASVSDEIIDSAKEFGLDINSDPVGLSTELLKWHDIAIIVADDVPKEILKDNKKYDKDLRVWDIPDTDSDEKEEIKRIIGKIERKVAEFVKEI